MKTQRIFIAIKIANTDEIRNVFQKLRLELRNEDIKWVKDSGLHITLLYIGSVDYFRVRQIHQKLKICASQISCFLLQLKSLGVFPDVLNPKVLWLGVSADRKLYELRNEIAGCLGAFLDLDHENFSPHLTMGRIKHGGQKPELIQKLIESYLNWEDEPLLIKSFDMMESVSTTEGVVYKTLKSYKLSI